MSEKLIMHQEGQTYYIYNPNGILIAQIFTGYDGQYAKDVECLNGVGRALAKRWGLTNGKN